MSSRDKIGYIFDEKLSIWQIFDKQILHICRKAERRKKREKHEDEESASALLW